MRTIRLSLATIVLCLSNGAGAHSQTEHAARSATSPPDVLVLVHQEFQFGKESTRGRIEAAISRACDRLTVPNSWIDLESITGHPEALSFDAFDSFAQVDEAFVAWRQFYASHPELGRMQEEIRALETNERTLIAVRRGDLSYQESAIDLSKARYMRVLEVRLRPGYEADFAEAFKILRAAYLKTNADLPWVVYQVNVGAPSPTFLTFVPMKTLKENDDLLALRTLVHEAEGESEAERMQQIARDAYVSTESNLYAVSPATSHVFKEFAEGDPDFWAPRPTPTAKPPEKRGAAKPPEEKDGKPDEKQ